MGFWSGLFGATKNKAAGDQNLAFLFEQLSQWTTGASFETEAPPPQIYKILPEGEGTSVRLSAAPIESLTGDKPRILSLGGQIAPNAPTLFRVAGMGRILLDLSYPGIESEAAEIKSALLKGAYKLRLSYAPERKYSLIRLQVACFGNPKKPLHTEALSDILNRNVQEFYCAVQSSGRYELSVHAKRQHLHSVFGSIPQEQVAGMYSRFERLVKNMKRIKPSERNFLAAFRAFESKHSLGEGL